MNTKQSILLSFFLRIILPSILAIVLFVLFLFFLLKPQFEQAIMDKKREMIRELVHATISILQKYYNDQIEGRLSQSEAQQIAISRIQYLRYGADNKDYFWITDTFPKMIMHPYVPELNGKDLTNYTDPTGKKLFVECVNVVRQSGSGYVDYMWQFKDDSTHILPKISYVKLFEPWQWIIGTGVYVDDVRREIAALTHRLILSSSIISLIILFILIFISYQSYKIELQRQQAEIHLRQSHEKYRSLVEASTEALVLAHNNIIIQANEWFLKMTQTENCSGIPISQFLIFPDTILETFTKKMPLPPFEAQIKTEKKEIDVLVNISEVQIGTDTFHIFSIRDISADLAHKRSMEQFQERLKDLLDQMHIGFVRTTIDPRGKILEANKYALQILGFTEMEKLKNVYVLDMLANEQDKRMLRRVLLEHKQIIRKPVQIRQPQGSVVTVLLSLKLIENDKPDNWLTEGFIEEIQPMANTHLYDHTSSGIQCIPHLTFKHLSELAIPPQFVHQNTSFHSVISLFQQHQYPFLIVQNEQLTPIGYITVSEIIDALFFHKNSTELKAVQMMKAPLVFIEPELSPSAAIALMQKYQTPLLILQHSRNENTVILKDVLLSKVPHSFSDIIERFKHSPSISDLAEQKKNADIEISRWLLTLQHPSTVMPHLSFIHDAILHRLMELAFQVYGPPPADFAFVVLGSEARFEPSLSTDQDNAIIYDDTATEHRQYFLQLGQYVCNRLNHIGYRLCPGNNMAMNEKWTQPLSIWKKYLSQWLTSGNAQDLLEVNIFFDIRFVYGSIHLLEQLRRHIYELISQHRAFTALLAQQCVSLKTNITDPLRIKDFIATLVSIARTYALSLQLYETSTLQRFSQLTQHNIINQQTFSDIQHVFSFLNALRLTHQAQQILNNVSPDNIIPLKSLSDFQVHQLKYAQSVIRAMQQKIAHDFKVY